MVSLTPVHGRRVAHIVSEGPQPGDFAFTSCGGVESAHLLFRCPCGCGAIGGVNLHPCGQAPVWTWDGNRERPTVQPSVRFLDGCRWHGFLRAGAWESC